MLAHDVEDAGHACRSLASESLRGPISSDFSRLFAPSQLPRAQLATTPADSPSPHQPTVLLNPVRFARLSFLCSKRVWSDRSCGRTRTYSGRRAWGSSHQHLASARSVADWRQCVFDPSTPCDSLRLSCSFLPALKARWHCVRPFTLWSWQPSYAVSPAEYLRLSGTPPSR